VIPTVELFSKTFLRMNTFFKTLAGAALLVLTWAAQAQMPQPPELAAKAYLLMDVTANQVLAAKDPDMTVEPASLTKLMTA
jgi:D-alanyl-D-alanine carboxypeptidase (penicillin-binding protein 5/6)